MKRIILVLLTISFYSCYIKKDVQSEAAPDASIEIGDDTDTIVGVITYPPEIAVPGYTEKEYFIVSDKDTSKFSLIVASNNATGNISGRIEWTSYKNFSSAFLTDTNAVSNAEVILKATNVEGKMTYDQQIRELQLILNFAAKEFEFKKLKHISFFMSDVTGFSKKIQEEYFDRYGEKVRRGRTLNSLILNSNYATSLNRILADHYLVIDQVNVTDYKPHFSASNPPEIVIEGRVICILQQLE